MLERRGRLTAAKTKKPPDHVGRLDEDLLRAHLISP